MRVVVCLLVLLVAIGCVAADQVFLANGDRISGDIRINADTIVVTSEVLGTVKVPRAAVSTIMLDEPKAIYVAGKAVKASSIRFESGSVSVRVSGGEVATAPAAALSSTALVPPTRPAPAQFLRSWSVSLDAGFTTARGNTSLNNLNFAVNAEQTTDRRRLKLSFTSLLAQTGTAGKPVTTAAVIRSGARYEFNVSNRMFAFGMLTFDSDQQRALDLRSVVGGGVGRRVADTTAATLDIFTGASFNRESFVRFPPLSSGEVLSGQELTYRFNSRTSITERLVVFPNFTSPGDFRITFDSTALLKLNNWLGWHSSVSERYFTSPVNVARNNDVIVTTGIRITLAGETRAFKPRSKIAPLSN